jgi:hypothetical protein
MGSRRDTNRRLKIDNEEKYQMASAIAIIAIAVCIIDLHVNWYHNRNNTIPLLKDSMIALSIILFIIVVNILIQKRK